MMLRFPGDPPQPVEELSEAEFFALFPPETRDVKVYADGALQSKHNLGRRVMCDLCGAPVAAPYVLVSRRRVYCHSCFEPLR